MTDFEFWTNSNNKNNTLYALDFAEDAYNKAKTQLTFGVVEKYESKTKPKGHRQNITFTSTKGGVKSYYNFKSIKFVFSDRKDKKFCKEDFTHLYIELNDEDGQLGWIGDKCENPNEVSKMMFMIGYESKVAYLSIETSLLRKIVNPMLKVAREHQGTISAKDLKEFEGKKKPYTLFTRCKRDENGRKTNLKSCVLFIIQLEDVLDSNYPYEIYDYDTMELIKKN